MHAVSTNKIDLPRREVDQKLAEGYAKTHNMMYAETSAKTRQGVHNAFCALVREIRQRRAICCPHNSTEWVIRACPADRAA